MESIFLGEVNGSGAELRSATKKVYEVLKAALKSMCLMYDARFYELLKALVRSEKDIFQGVRAVICNKSHNICRIAEHSNLKHNQLKLQDINHCVELLSQGWLWKCMGSCSALHYCLEIGMNF